MSVYVATMLKGLGEQVFCAKVNTLDAAICLAAVVVAVPRFGVNGYIAVIYVSEAINAALSIGRLTQIASLNITLRGVLSLLAIPFASLAAGSLAAKALCAAFSLPTPLAVCGYALAYLAVGGAMLAIKRNRHAKRHSVYTEANLSSFARG